MEESFQLKLFILWVPDRYLVPDFQKTQVPCQMEHFDGDYLENWFRRSGKLFGHEEAGTRKVFCWGFPRWWTEEDCILENNEESFVGTRSEKGKLCTFDWLPWMSSTQMRRSSRKTGRDGGHWQEHDDCCWAMAFPPVDAPHGPGQWDSVHHHVINTFFRIIVKCWTSSMPSLNPG